MDEFDRSYEEAASWLLESFRVNRHQGSSAWSSRFFHPVKNWSHPYPETTGYIIPTVYDHLRRDPPDAAEWAECISQSVRWLLRMQLPSGAFPGGHAASDDSFFLTTSDYLLRRGHPPAASIFNSGQILRGLTRHYRETQDPATLESVERCVRFLLGSVGEDGKWAVDAYAGSSSPSYFVYVTAALLSARDLLPNPDEIAHTAVRSLAHVVSRASNETGFIVGMGFGAQDTAVTHTIGYTLAGLLESARALGPNGREYARCALVCLRALCASLGPLAVLPGKYLPGWVGDRGFTCVTGNCQIALCCLDASETDGDRTLRDIALRICRSATSSQRGSGGFPGSLPFYGEYMRCRCVNWAAKYYMDLVNRLRAAGLE